MSKEALSASLNEWADKLEAFHGAMVEIDRAAVEMLRAYAIRAVELEAELFREQSINEHVGHIIDFIQTQDPDTYRYLMEVFDKTPMQIWWEVRKLDLTGKFPLTDEEEQE